QLFHTFIHGLNQDNITTIIIPDEGTYAMPDSILPNHCVSFHKRTAVLYPMFAENRRRERTLNYVHALPQQGFTFESIIDYTDFEKENRFLEGTGSLVLDHVNRIAYCALSPRADAGIAHQFCLDMGYEIFIFEANQTVDGLRK